MAGSIPPLFSSTPPPLSVFDDDEEEDEDEFGMYTAADDIDYNECNSFREKNEDKQNGGMSKGEQDSTSQDSATDSGLCPDSEGVSPTPHSDEERTIKQSANSVCDNQCHQPPDIPTLTCRLTPTCGLEGFDSSSGNSAVTNLSNGHVAADDRVDDFDLTSVELTEQSLPPEIKLEDNLINSIGKEEIGKSVDMKREEVLGNTSSIFGSENNQDKDTVDLEEFSTSNTTSAFVETKFTSHNNYSTLNEPSTSDNLDVHEQHLSLEDHTKNSNSPILKCEQITSITPGNDVFDPQEGEFDDFSNFNADFSKFDFPNNEQCDTISEHSKPISEQSHWQEMAKVVVPPNDTSDDEFSDFTEFSSSDCAFVSAQKSNSVENVPHIPNVSSDDCDLRTDSIFQDWLSVFPSSSSSDPELVEGEHAMIPRKNDSVWSRLIPLESSPALSYQWAESLANRHLLTALSIDSRNILMMPWMPRFAANLSCGPLQPVKSQEILQPTLAPFSAPVHSSSGQESVPDAHFDWVGSGLTNPLDCPKPIKQQMPSRRRVESILNSFPNLSFMKKTYIDFPVNEG